jgi:hypothetical protein
MVTKALRGLWAAGLLTHANLNTGGSLQVYWINTSHRGGLPDILCVETEDFIERTVVGSHRRDGVHVTHNRR